MTNDTHYDLSGCEITSANGRLTLKFLAPGFKEQFYNTLINLVDLNNFEKVQLRALMVVLEPTENYELTAPLEALTVRSDELCELTVKETVKSLTKQFLTAKNTGVKAPIYAVGDVEVIGLNNTVINGMYLYKVPYGDISSFVVFRRFKDHGAHLVNLSLGYLPSIPTNQRLEMTSGVMADRDDTVKKLLHTYVQRNFNPTYEKQLCIENIDGRSGIKAVFEEPGQWVFYDY